MKIRFGVHCSLKNGMVGALDEAKALGCESMQIFTRSPRVWKMKPPTDETINEFARVRKEYGIYPLAVHAPYLPNLATSNEELYVKSAGLLVEDYELSVKLKADYLVIHPGSFSENSDAKTGVERIATAINGVFKRAKGDTFILLENVAGGGRRIGSTFKQLSEIIDKVSDKGRMGICLDTAHACGAGYDLSKKTQITKMISDFNEFLGMDRLKMMHLNDSMTPCASNRDRHEHIGKGYIGLKGFSFLIESLSDKAYAGILETPKDSPDADKNNLKLLFGFRKSH